MKTCTLQIRQEMNALWIYQLVFFLSAFLFTCSALAQESLPEAEGEKASIEIMAFEDLPKDIQVKYIDIRDQLNFVKVNVKEDNQGKLLHVDPLNEIEPKDIHTIEVLKEDKSIYIMLKKEGADLELLHQQSGFSVVESSPTYPDGMDAFYNYIRQEITYPKSARKMKSTGQVVVDFVVEKDGSITSVNVSGEIHKSIQSEIMRVLENADPFEAGKQRGKKIRTRMSMPMTFQLDTVSLNDDGTPKGMIIVGEANTKPSQMKVDARFKNGKWIGKVVDEDGNPLIGANIIVTGTTSGTISDIKGKFEVAADKTQTLHVSFVGFDSVEVRK